MKTTRHFLFGLSRHILVPAFVALGSGHLAIAAVNYSTAGALITENFDSLPTDPPSNANIQSSAYTSGWQDDSTTVAGTSISVAGWYLWHPIVQTEGGVNGHQRVRFGPGSANTGSFWVLATGGPTDTEKALGSLGSNTMSPVGEGMFFGLRLFNDTGVTLNEFTLTYDGEQYRNGGSGTANVLSFAYSTSATVGDWTNSSFTAVSALDFTAPQVGTTSATVDGNVAGKVADITATVNGFSWTPGSDLWLRWTDINDSGADDGLAIDNVRFSAIAVVPEPSTMALAGLAGFSLLALRRRK